MTDQDRAILSDIARNTAETAARFAALEKRLYGNGQPGDIDRLYSATGELKTSHDKAQGAVIVTRWIIGAIGAVLAVLEGLAHRAMAALRHG
jgi:hypothetical protein